MRGLLLPAALVCALASGCLTARLQYEAHVYVAPMPVRGQYEVAFEIHETSETGATRLLSCPRVVVVEGKKGELLIGDAISSIKCAALVEGTNGMVRVATRVRIVERTRRVWASRQILLLDPRTAPAAGGFGSGRAAVPPAGDAP